MSAPVWWLHVATVAVMAVVLVWLWARASANVFRTSVIAAGLIAGWLGLSAVLAISGVTARFDAIPPGVASVVGPALLTLIALVIVMSRPGARLMLMRMPLPALILAQTFRLPVELVLAALVDAGQLPALLSYHGTNFDILTGVTAPLAAWMAAQGYDRAVTIWNWLGLALVFNVATTAILAAPGPLRMIEVEPSSAYLASFPMIWLPGFLVQVAFLLHGLALLQLAQRQQRDFAPAAK